MFCTAFGPAASSLTVWASELCRAECSHDLVNADFNHEVATRSLEHSAQQSFGAQMGRLEEAGYQPPFLSRIAESLLRDLRNQKQNKPLFNEENERVKRRTTVIPYVHQVLHKVKKIAEGGCAKVLMSAPNKLSKLCARVNKVGRKHNPCKINHKTKYVGCRQNVVYEIPLDCKRSYVGQTGICINLRLQEHANSLKSNVGGHLAALCRQCKCQTKFDQCRIIRRYANKRTREIFEAFCISQRGDKCVSKPSLRLNENEIAYLSNV